MLKSTKLLTGFGLFEALAFTIGLMLMNEFPQTGGDTNWGILAAALISAALLWWSVAFLIDAILDRTTA